MTVSHVSQDDSVSEDGADGDTTSDGTTTSAVPAQQPSAPSLDRLVAEAMTVASQSGLPDLPDLVERYWRLVPDEEVAGRSVAHLLAATEAHLELAAQRLPGEMKLHVQRGEEGQHSALLIVTDDMPFLVDSVTAAISARGLEVDLVVHPQVVVEREALGALARVTPHVEPDDAGPGQMVESWMRLEVGRMRDDALAATLHNDLQRVLTDVREAVEDWPRMRAQALTLAQELDDPQPAERLPVPEKDITDSVALLRWLANDNFTFLGYREYDLVGGAGGERLLKAKLGTGLGILRQDPAAARVLSSMTPEAYERVLEKRLLIITKANSRSTVHRNAYLDYIGFKTFDGEGNVIGERRFLGLFTSSAYLTSVRDLPVVQRKVNEVIGRSGLSLRSHSGKDLMAILEDYPREELFQIATDDLFRTVMGVVRLAGRRQVRLFARKDQYGRFISCLVYLPRDRFTTVNRLKIQEILLQELNGIGVDYTTRVSDATLARIHFIVRTNPANPPGEIDMDALSAQIADATRLWEDDFQLVLERTLGEDHASQLTETYGDALPETYKDSHSAHEAAQDLAKLELLEEPGQLVMHLFRRRKNDDDVRFKVFRYGEPMMLSDVLPVLHSLGVRVEDERPYEVERADGTIHIYDFGLALPGGSAGHRRDPPEGGERLLRDVAGRGRGGPVQRTGRPGRADLASGRRAALVREISAPGGHHLLAGVHGDDAHDVPAHRLQARVAVRDAAGPPARRDLGGARPAVGGVGGCDPCRSRRGGLAGPGPHPAVVPHAHPGHVAHVVLPAAGADPGRRGRPKSYVAFKLDPQTIPDLPAPRPRYEIFVYSPRFEGVHLRFGPVARGGLRWSDRREDFRTEVLGLVKAQMVKNAVIVPVGAKGGFVLKQAPPASDRDAFLAEGVAVYKQFISAMLDVTDNIVGGSVVPPVDVVRHDGDDPYLVVAADKGTATFSDIANEISTSYGFWLGDAFASGGSAGYDHKKMGITAKGAWESVRRHFREQDIDTQTQDFTVVGIGDMSGDVFGNGVLLSEHIRLVAAFDHRHIFVDPEPEAASTYVERRRLFNLPRSSWDDFSKSLISAGGGVWPRTAKSIPISAEMRQALGIAEPMKSMSPSELIRAILRAPVDLLWNGGIGTYVKASFESQLDVGDKTNDGVRVNGAQLRARVVGEGGNLGLTQRGRVEYAQKGGRVVDDVRHAHICTDFIDNSAGVDCSDHEVNIKILLGGVVADGELTLAERDELLAEMTDEVAELVLRDNYDQATVLGTARAQSRSLLPVHRRMISDMERAGHLDRELEAMPTDEDLAARAAAATGLTSPEFAVLLAYTKIILEREINESPLPDEAWTQDVLVDYFPTPLRDRYADRMPGHRLRREIVTTSVVNEVVNRGGISFVFRAVEETGANSADVIRAYVVVREAFGLPALWRSVEALDNQLSTTAQTTLYLEVRRLVDRAVRWLVTNRRSPLDVNVEIARLKPALSKLLPELAELVRGRERETLQAHARALVERAIPPDVAEAATRVMYSFGLLDVAEVAQQTRHDLTEVAGVYFVLSERFRVDDLLSKISALPREDRWETLARMALRYDLYAALAALTIEVLAATDPAATAEDRVTQWEQANATSIARTRNAIGEFDEARADLAPLSVLLRQIRTLVKASST